MTTLTLPSTTSRLRVASVPGGHPYVRHLGLDVDLLADPQPRGAGPGQWWPPVMLDPAWTAANADRFDVMHVHFGVETVDPGELASGLAAVRAAGRPLVVTVHDLEHPQLSGPAAFRDHLDVLLAHADAVTTLTTGAAEAIAAGWGRTATVISHPHMHPLALPLPRRDGPGRVVGMHLRDLRPNVDGPRATAALIAAVRDLGDVTVRVFLRDRVRDEAARNRVRRLCASAGPRVQLVEAPRPTDAELARELAGLDAAVLPYAHGTHSGWLELCWDLGVPVAAGRVGFLAEQHPVAGFDWEDPTSLADAIGASLRAPRADLETRRALRLRRRREIADRHLAVYRAALEAHGAEAPRARTTISP